MIEQTRAALAAEADGPAVPEGREPASVVGEPSDEEIMELMTQQMHDDLAAAVRAMAEQEGIDSTRAKGVMRIMLNRHVVDLARAALARFSHQSAPPAEGEVAELVCFLEVGGSCPAGAKLTRNQCMRVAELLQRQALVPVPVSERLPGPEDCDAEGRCWWLVSHQSWPCLYLMKAYIGLDAAGATHWLPAHALPLPSDTKSGGPNE